GQNAEALLGYERACRLDDWMSGELDPDSPTEELFIGWEEPSQATPMSWPERVRLRVELGDVLRRMGDLDGAERRYSEARRRIQRNTEDSSDPLDVARWKSRIDFRLSISADVRGDVSGGRHLVERAIHRAQLCAMGAELAQMMAHLAALHLRELDTQACRDASLKGLRVLRTAAKRSARWRDAATWLLRTLGGAFYTRGEMVRAERCYLQASRLFDAQENPYEVSRALNNVAAARFALANLEGARDSFRASLELADRSGDLWMTMTALGNLGEVEHAIGRHELARDLLQEAVELGERIGARGDLADCYRNLGDASAALDRHAEAVTALLRALELARTGGGRVYLPSVITTAEHVCQRANAAGADVGRLEQALAEVRATQELA
ncbi:MAG TPA: tetratricopeptide repeat protein, partial [Polyangiaceae bacterium]|nr:tetratricopeptide repeat protein [Polyangiaceae bacterium]